MKPTIRTLLALLAVLLVLLPVQAVSAAQGAQGGQGACLIASSVAIRQGPGGGYRSLGYIRQGQCISILGLSADGHWYHIAQGWVWAAPYLWAAAVLPVAPSANPAATSSASNVTAETWVSENSPEPGSDVVAYVLVRVNGAPRAGIPVQFAWKFGTGTVVCSQVTTSDGLAACLQNAGAAAPGKVVLVQGSFQALGRSYTTATSFAPNGDCDPSYPDFCLLRGQQRLGCRDIPYRNFEVLPPDPHGFDPDGNGVGCEG